MKREVKNNVEVELAHKTQDVAVMKQKTQNLAVTIESVKGEIKQNKPVGFLRPDWAPEFRTPPVPNAPSSECPRASIAARRRTAGSIRISRRASCCCSTAIAGIAIGANFKIYLRRQFCSNRVEFFYNTQETQTQKMMDQNFEIRIMWFLSIFWHFQKGVARSLCGRFWPLWSQPN